MEFAVEDILFEEMEAASSAAAAPPPVTAEDAARSAASSGLILPSMTIDPADTKTPYSDATQVGERMRKERREASGRDATRTWPSERPRRRLPSLHLADIACARGGGGMHSITCVIRMETYSV